MVKSPPIPPKSIGLLKSNQIKDSPIILSRSMKMFDGNNDDEPVTLTINKSYANRYENWREKEEKQKRK